MIYFEAMRKADGTWTSEHHLVKTISLTTTNQSLTAVCGALGLLDLSTLKQLTDPPDNLCAECARNAK